MFAAFYFPLLFGGSHAYLTINDNLDGDVVYSAVMGMFYVDPVRAQHLLLGGNMPIYLLYRMTWPLGLLWVLKSKFLAYVLNDLIVRVAGMAGMFCLAKRIGSTPPVAVLAGLLFSLSLSYTVYGLTVAGIPAVLYLVQEESEGRRSLGRYALLFLLGWNSVLLLSGIFLLAAVPVLRCVLFGDANGGLRSCAVYASGLAAGSAGLLYAAASGLHLHREAWKPAGYGLFKAVEHFAYNQVWPFTSDFYMVSTPLTILYAALWLALCFGTWNRRVAAGIGGILLISLLNSTMHLNAVERLQAKIGGLVKTIHFDRFYFLESVILIATWVIAVRVVSPRLRKILLAAGSVQLAWSIFLAPHVFYPITHALGKDPIPTFDEYFSWPDYEAMKPVIADSAVISVGVDPMAAVMNGISTLDGYYNAYPLAYKAKFRRIIAAQLKVSGKEDYFDGWGSRVYTFADDPRNLSLDYCAARDLGARFVISRFDIASQNLELVTTARRKLRLYSIVGCRD
jgi:uncharacterized protein DUF6044